MRHVDSTNKKIIAVFPNILDRGRSQPVLNWISPSKNGMCHFCRWPFITCVESHHRWSIEKIKFKNKRKQSQKHHELNQKCRNSPFYEPFRNRSIVGTIWGWSGFSIPIKLVKHSEGSHVNNKYAGLLSRGWTALKGQHSRVTGAAKLCNWVYPLVN